MIVVLLKVFFPFLILLIFAALVRRYLRSKYPRPRALGRVLPELCVVDAQEILTFKELAEEEWAARPRLRPALRASGAL